MLGSTRGCSGVGTSVQEFARKCSGQSGWLVAQAGWAPGDIPERREVAGGRDKLLPALEGRARSL